MLIDIDFSSDKDAIIYNNTHVPYKSFNELVNNMQVFFHESNLKEGDVLVIYMRRTPIMLASIIAALKSGITYVPIDLSLPEERIKFVLESCKANAIIADNPYNGYAFQNYSVSQENKNTVIFTNPNRETSVSNESDRIAYILYTSGSTGAPKGVMISSKALQNFIEAMPQEIHIHDCKKIICLTSISFDIFFLEAIAPFFWGLTVVLADDDSYYNVRSLTKLIEENEVDILQLTPSRMQQFIYYDNNLNIFKDIKCLLLGGEQLSNNLLIKCQESLNAKIFNLYGPTETTIWSSVKNLTDADGVTIGSPIKNTYFMIMGDDHQENRQFGELYIAGEGLMSGYVNDYELTKKALYIGADEKTYYKTGDLVKIDASGEYVFVGRVDNQIKLNGYRIELEEIEAVLKKTFSFSNCIVKVDNSRLICYFNGDQNLETNNIISMVSRYLPKYMIPTKFIYLQQFPLNISGKVDRSKV